MNNTYLSKSKYCQCVQCEKIFWLNKYKPEVMTEDPSKQERFEKGNVVADGGTLVREAATSHINAASEIANEYVVPPDEDYTAYIAETDNVEAPAEEIVVEGGEN